MANYRYEAANAQGGTERGLLDADSERAARNALRARGLTPLKVEATRSGKQSSANLLRPRLSDGDLAWATRQLASLLSARLSIDEALSATLEQAEKKHIAEVLTSVRGEVRAGHRLADALNNHPRDFPDIYRALIAAGEESGDLADVLEQLADYIENRNVLRSKVMTAFIYPCVVATVSFAIVIFLLSYVVPQVVSAFTQARQTLPFLTRIMLWLSEFIQQWGGALLLVLVLLILLWRTLMKRPPLRLAWHQRLLRLPVVGKVLLGLDTARFASTLAILTSSGVPLLKALDAARHTMGNLRLRQHVDDAADQVREGVSLARALQSQRCFPPLLIHLTASGEKTGTLPPLLNRAASTLSADIERRALAMTALLEPLTILVMGGFVLLIVLAVLMPIIEINQLVG